MSATAYLAEHIAFGAPRYLLLVFLIAPVVYLANRYSLAPLGRRRRWTSLGLRGGVLLCLVLALARSELKYSSKQICGVAAMDVSASVSEEQIAFALAWLGQAARSKPEGDVLKFVSFAKEPRVEAALPVHRHDELGTDPAAAARLLPTLCDTDHLVRLALLSDGLETSGDFAAVIPKVMPNLRAFTVALPDRKDHDALVSDLRVEGELQAGAPFTLKVEITSTTAQSARVVLTQDGRPNGLGSEERLELGTAPKTATFKVQIDEPGMHRLRAELFAPNTGDPKNDAAELLVDVLGPPRVLYVEAGAPTGAAFPQALRAEHIDVDVRAAVDLKDAKALAKYDLLAFSDVAATEIGPSDMQTLRAFVKEGGGLFVAGGDASFGRAYAGTAFEKLLPVRSDSEKERHEPHLGLALVVDRSGSMSGEKIEMAKSAAAATVDVLGADDLVTIITFDSVATVVSRLQRASNRMRILADIARIQPQGGTHIYPALKEAIGQLGSAPARIKHVILLTDGQAPYEGIADLVDDMRQQKITTSAVGLGNGADRTLLAMIAERGGGRFYHTDEAAAIPRIFTRETREAARSSVREAPLRMSVVRRTEALRGLDFGSAPPLRGYVDTQIRPSAELLLAASTSGDPLLARWRVGLGQVLAWTSDLGRRWTSDLARWPAYPKLLAQLVRSGMRRRPLARFPMRATVALGWVEVEVEAIGKDDKFLDGLTGTLEIHSASSPVTLAMRQRAPGLYAARFRADPPGSKWLRAHFELGKDPIGQSGQALFLPDAPELTRRPVDRAWLEAAAQAGRGRVITLPSQLFDPGADFVVRRRKLANAWAFAALPLLVLDVLVRRLRKRT